MDEATGEWEKLHNEEVHDFYSSPKYYWDTQIKVKEMGWACGTYGREEKCIQVFKETRWEVVDWVHLAQDKKNWWALVSTVVSFRVPQNAWSFLTG
jgi:hypothetical protein